VDVRDYKLVHAVAQHAKNFSLDTPQTIKDQASVGSCVAHALSYTMEHIRYVLTKIYTLFSVGFIYGNKADTTSPGMELRDALKIVQLTGDVFNADFDYNLEVPEIEEKVQEVGLDKLKKLASKNKVLTYFQLTGTDDIKIALEKYGYVFIGVPWYNDNNFDYIVNADQIITNIINQGTDLAGYHALAITGWDDDLAGWRIVNSWGTDWGDNGCAILPYSYPLSEAWGVSGETISSDDVQKTSENVIFQFVVKIINWIINLLSY